MPGSIEAGQQAVLRAAPHSLRQHQGRMCQVLRIDQADYATLARIRIDDGSETGVEVAGIPVNYLGPAPAAKPKRRSPLNMRVERDDRSEAEKQAEVVAWLECRGYTVMETGAGRKRVVCRECGSGFFPSGWQGNTDGCPDLLITHRRWPACVWTTIEMKQSAKSDRRPAQVALVEDGRSVFAWSLEMALRAVYDVELLIGVDPHPDLAERFAGERVAA